MPQALNASTFHDDASPTIVNKSPCDFYSGGVPSAMLTSFAEFTTTPMTPTQFIAK